MRKAGYWPDEYLNKRRTPSAAIGMIKNGQRVFIGSSCGEPQLLVRELAEQSNRISDLEIVRLMSLETAPLTLIADQSKQHSFTVRSFYLGSAKPRALAQMRRFITPINLSAIPTLFKTRRVPIHVALVQVSPPDDFGWMSLGVSVDVTLAAAKSADLVIVQVNPLMPRVLGQSFLHVNEVDVVVEHEEPILSVPPPPESPAAEQIAGHVAKLIDDGSTLQLSLGNSPHATLLALKNKNDLGIHTQFMTDGIMHLVSRGVITNRYKGINNGKSVASAAIGSTNLYEFMHDNPGLEFHPSEYVNNPAIIAQHNKMVTLNVGMAVDLTGQVAVDALPYNMYSGVTGVMDFMRGAAFSPGGKSVLMLFSTTMDGKSSRIVPNLENTPTVIPRGDVQYVATEYGVVNLFGKSLQERAMALISIAHPDFRQELFEQARQAGLLGPERTLNESLRGVYPQHLEETRVIDGQEVLIRPAKLVDERRIQEHFYGLDHDDVVLRFFHEKTSFLREDVSGVAQIDYVKNLTIVALVGDIGFGQVVALGGYYLDPATNLAEVAFSTLKSWQSKGLASAILLALARAARDRGIKGLVAYTNPRNQNMIRLFKKLPYKISSTFEDEMLVLKADFSELVKY
jgi:acyl-CoA hydrolase/RimJ/RimL family protein N-acetyltransferase